MKVKLEKKNLVITIPVKQLETLLSPKACDTCTGEIKMEETTTPTEATPVVETPVEETNVNIEPEVTTINPVDTPQGTEGNTTVQQ